ncbi:MAG: sulfatase-like hydrolase/transferase [Phycisphaerales bacterium]|nr:sulfatase-like hydrolase/transferase [Phycisphaerales bacterium]
MTTLAAALASASAFAAPPDIVLLVADDLGWGDVSCLDGDFPTPAIDSLAAQGAILDAFYSGSSSCTPSRYAMFTGRNSWRSQGGLDRVLMFFTESDRAHGLRPGEVTFAERLSDAGYDTMLAGKWHLGHGKDDSSPIRHGFDRFHGCRGGCVDYFTHAYGFIPDWWKGMEPFEEEGEATDLIASAATNFIREHDRTTGDDDPILLVVAFTAPHYGKSTLEASGADPRTLITRRAGKPRTDAQGNLVQPVNSLQATAEDLQAAGVRANPDPDLARAVSSGEAEVDSELRRAYYRAMLKALDDGVAEVLAALEDSGRGDAIVLFTADNGPDETVSNAGNSGRFKGAKATLHEGGIRVPTILRWPGVVKPASRQDQVGGFIDLHPTICELAGVNIPEDADLDGMDLTNSWRGADNVDRTIGFRRGKSRAIRAGDWKWIDGRLYNLADDPGETSDLAEKFSEHAAWLQSLAEADS